MDMFVAVIWYQNVDRCFAFNAVSAIYNVYIGILSYCWFVITNETCHMSCDWVALILMGMKPLLMGGFLSVDLIIHIVTFGL